MKTKYDPEIIGRFADKLYSQAFWTIFGRTFFGLLFGAILGGVAGVFYINAALAEPSNMPAIIGALLFGLFGYSSAQARAFELRLQAQSALCQVQIEKNTRRD